jgi:hypothetical protein
VDELIGHLGMIRNIDGVILNHLRNGCRRTDATCLRVQLGKNGVTRSEFFQRSIAQHRYRINV